MAPDNTIAPLTRTSDRKTFTSTLIIVVSLFLLVCIGVLTFASRIVLFDCVREDYVSQKSIETGARVVIERLGCGATTAETYTILLSQPTDVATLSIVANIEIASAALQPILIDEFNSSHLRIRILNCRSEPTVIAFRADGNNTRPRFICSRSFARDELMLLDIDLSNILFNKSDFQA